jgi:UDP-N-acetylglucosamine 2-epimerase (non-hydrolysing)
VQGDTSTTYFAALAARNVGAQVHHVEAGLRSGSIGNPFPEEFHRRAVARIAHTHYAPTPGARANLLHEGVAEEDILLTGNTGIDSLEQLGAGEAPERSRDEVLITLHRHENRGAVIHALRRTVMDLATRFPTLHFIWVRHSNPAVDDELADLGSTPAPNVRIVPPMPHRRLIGDPGRYAVIMTDSGGLQEEATHLGIPLMILRDRTERPEALRPDHGVLCPPGEHQRIIEAFEMLVRLGREPHHVFGSGNAGERIVDHLLATAHPKV